MDTAADALARRRCSVAGESASRDILLCVCVWVEG